MVLFVALSLCVFVLEIKIETLVVKKRKEYSLTHFYAEVEKTVVSTDIYFTSHHIVL